MIKLPFKSIREKWLKSESIPCLGTELHSSAFYLYWGCRENSYRESPVFSYALSHFVSPADALGFLRYKQARYILGANSMEREDAPFLMSAEHYLQSIENKNPIKNWLIEAEKCLEANECQDEKEFKHFMNSFNACFGNLYPYIECFACGFLPNLLADDFWNNEPAMNIISLARNNQFDTNNQKHMLLAFKYLKQQEQL